VLKRSPAEAIVCVRLHNPFIDPVLIDRLIASAACPPACDYVGFRSRDGRPAFRSAVGMFAEWFRAAAIVRADRDADSTGAARCPTRHMLAHPDQFALRLAEIPAPLDRRDLRLSLEVEEDWGHAHDIIEALGPEELDWQTIAGLLDRQPAMRLRMAELNLASFSDPI
jgi:spore coat polysaccharide biosynthesis protein SpsF (cytidylyltransferase family)